MSPEVKLILEIVAGIAAAIAAWELKDRLKIRDKKLDHELSDGEMETKIISKIEGKEIIQTAKVRFDEDRYNLLITSSDDSITPIKQSFASRESLETFLCEHTLFRISDFVKTV